MMWRGEEACKQVSKLVEFLLSHGKNGNECKLDSSFAKCVLWVKDLEDLSGGLEGLVRVQKLQAIVMMTAAADALFFFFK